MKVKKAELLSSMRKCLPGVEKGSSIVEGADTFVFANKAIHSYNDNISVSVPFPFEEEVNCAEKALDFFKLISKLPTEEIEFKVEEERVKILSGSVDVEMTKIEDTLSKYITSLNIHGLEWKPLPDNFFGAVQLCKISCNRAPQRGIFVEKAEMMSTDIARINLHKLDSEMDRFWIDDPAVVELMKIQKLKEISVNPTWVHFRSEDGTVFSTKRKDDTGYPTQRIRELIDQHKKEKGDPESKLPKGLADVADRVSTLSSEINGTPVVQMRIGKKDLEFFAERHTGRIKEKLALEEPFDQDIDIKVWIDPVFLIEAAKKVTGFFVKSIKKEERTIKTLVFYNEKYTQIAATKGDAE